MLRLAWDEREDCRITDFRFQILDFRFTLYLPHKYPLSTPKR